MKPMEEDPDGEVSLLGVTMTDPKVLRATQTVSAFICFSAFILWEDLATIVSTGKVPIGFLLYTLVTNVSVPAPLIIGLHLFVNIGQPVAGYFGLLWNSVSLLRLFGCLAALDAFQFYAIIFRIFQLLYARGGAHPWDPNDDLVEMLVFRVLLAACFTGSAYYGFWLANQVKSGLTLPGQKKQHNADDYMMLGMQMGGMHVMKDVQNLLSACMLVFFFALYHVLFLFDAAVESVFNGSGVFFAFYSVLSALWLAMVVGSVVGVKKNSPKLLLLASVVGALFGSIFAAFSIFAMSLGGFRSFGLWSFTLANALANFWGALHAWKLKNRVQKGEQLNRFAADGSQAADFRSSVDPGVMGRPDSDSNALAV